VALFLRRRGAKRVFVLRNGSTDSGDYAQGLTSGFRTAAKRIALRIVGSARWNRRATGQAELARRVGRSGADAVFLGDYGSPTALSVVRALRARLGPHVTLVAGDGFMPIRDFVHQAGRAALGMYVSVPVIPDERLPSAGRRFLRRFSSGEPGGRVPSGTYVNTAAQGAAMLLAAIERSNGTRRSVLANLRSTKVVGGILGSFGFDAAGDMSPVPVTIFRITGKTQRGSNLVSDYQGGVIDSIVRVPTALGHG
jgi:ABC-type branched-subunit amino acid transport system substrate-binding protein